MDDESCEGGATWYETLTAFNRDGRKRLGTALEIIEACISMLAQDGQQKRSMEEDVELTGGSSFL
jgi:hypothetical protein